MKYAILIYGDESMMGEPDPAEMGAWFAYTQEAQTTGAFSAGEALEPTATAKSVRVRDGKTEITDGPFAETKEQLGGFYILECKDLDAAIEWAKKIPSVGFGSVEVRPVVSFDMPGQ